MKKYLFTIFLVGLLFCTLTATASAANVGNCGDNLLWSYSDGVLTIEGYGDMTDYKYNTPWTEFKEDIIAVNLPAGLTSIGDYAFYKCKNLPNIVLPEGITSIGESAFYDCDILPSINIPDSVTSIDDSAFYSCDSLTGITIPSSVRYIKESAFQHCNNLTYVDLSYGLTWIEDSAFSHCTSLSSITIPDSVTSIGEDAFQYCSSLTSITIPGTIKVMGERAFQKCTGLTSVIISNGVTAIANYAFSDCDSLTSIAFPNSVTSIGNFAFNACDNLTTITIPVSVTTIGLLAFGDCDNLTGVYYGGSTEDKKDMVRKSTDACFENTIWYYDVYIETAEVLLDKDESVLVEPEDTVVTQVEETAIAVDIDDTDSVIQNSGICGDSLTWFYSDGILTIDGIGDMHDYDANISSPWSGFNNDIITIWLCPTGITSIGAYAFSGCSMVTSITVPDSITTIGDGAFSGCDSLCNVYYEGSIAQKNKLEIGSNSQTFEDSTWHYVNVANTDEAVGDVDVPVDATEEAQPINTAVIILLVVVAGAIGATSAIVIPKIVAKTKSK